MFKIDHISGPGEEISYTVPAETMAAVVTVSTTGNFKDLAKKFQRDRLVMEQILEDGKVQGAGEYLGALGVLMDLANVK